MESGEFWQLSTLSNARLESGLGELLAVGYRTEARIIAYLAEVEQRKLHLKEGSESLFDYCTRRLHLSNSEAFHRITAARIARQFPVVFNLLEQRQLHLTAVCLLRDYLTPENHRELLAQASHKTKWQVQELLARHFPRPDVESRVRKLPAPRSAIAPIAQPTGTAIAPETNSHDCDMTLQNSRLRPMEVPGPGPCRSQVAPSQVAPSRPDPSPARGAPVPIQVEPLSEARYRIQLNASATLKEKLDRLRALTSHSNPSGDLAVVIERAVDVALEQVEKRRFAKSNRPRVQSHTPSQTQSNGAETGIDRAREKCKGASSPACAYSERGAAGDCRARRHAVQLSWSKRLPMYGAGIPSGPP